MEAGQWRRYLLRPWLFAGVATLLVGGCGFFPLLGLPGALLMMCTQPLVDRVLDAHTVFENPNGAGFGAWNLALLVTLAWPVSFLPATLLAFELGARRRWPW